MRRRVSAAVLLALALPCGFVTASAQQTLAAAAPTDAPLREARRARAEPAVVWHTEDPTLAALRPPHHYNAFSADGARIGVVYANRAIRLLDAADGSVRSELRPESTQRRRYSMALASTGKVAVGRQGSMQVHDVSAGGMITVFPCVAPVDAAGPRCPPTSLAFSPDASLLAFHELASIGRTQEDLGAVGVVDLELGRPTEMDATTALAKLSFSSDRQPAAAFEDDGAEAGGFRIWHTRDWQLPQSMLGSGWTVGAVPADSTETPERLVAVFRSGSNLVMRDFADDRLLWAVPLIRRSAQPANTASTLGALAVTEIAPNGEFLISYEAPIGDSADDSAAGSIVIRRTLDGAIVELYDVPGVLDIAVAPDSRTFVYSSAAGGGHTALVRVPAL